MREEGSRVENEIDRKRKKEIERELDGGRQEYKLRLIGIDRREREHTFRDRMLGWETERKAYRERPRQ